MTNTTANSPTGGALIDMDKLEALARAATPGPWELRATEWSYYAVEAAHPEWGAMCEVAPSRKSNMEFIVAANPAAVLALIALARAGQQAGEVAVADADLDYLLEYLPPAVRAAAKAKVADLRAKLASAQQDAERYRWLRERIPGSAYRIAGVIYSEGGSGVDAAIDAARAQLTNPTGN